MDTQRAPSQSRALPRTVILLGWVSFLADISGEMVYPLIPLFVVGVLGATATSLGGIEGAAQCMAAIMTGWAGLQSDRVRRRVPFVRLGYGIPVIGKSLLALAVAWPMVLAGRLIDRLGKGLRSSPRDALIADAAGADIRGRAFGFHRAMDTAGALVGVLVSAALLWWFGRAHAPQVGETGTGDSGWVFRLVFGISAAFGLLSLGLTLLVREPTTAHDDADRAATTIGGRLGLPAGYWRTLAILLIFALANSTDAFLLLRARDLGYSPATVVLAYALFNATYTIASYPAGVLSDRIGRWRIIGLGWIVYMAVYAGFAITGPRGVWALLALYGIYMAATDGVGKALIADHAPKSRRGAALGVFHMLSGLTTLLASIVGGVLWDRVGPSATFWFGAAMALLALVAAALLRPRIAAAQSE